MRIPTYLSNSSVNLFYSDRMEFYLRYLAENRPPRFPQTKPMSVGSAFDAYVKAYLVEKLIGDRPAFYKDKLFEEQVEKHNWDWARKAGQYAFDAYERSGALRDLLIELEQASGEPRFEFTVRRTIDGVPLLGKPDLWFITHDGIHVIFDWKVNGYCSRKGQSPKPGYVMVSDGWDEKRWPRSRSHRQAHKGCHPMQIGGITVNVAKYLEDIDGSWSQQTCLYGWLMGEEVGGRFVTGIDQLACSPGDPDEPRIRVARHRSRASKGFQEDLWIKIKNVWDTIHSGHIFDDMSYEESKNRQLVLDGYHKVYNQDDPLDKWFAAATQL